VRLALASLRPVMGEEASGFGGEAPVAELVFALAGEVRGTTEVPVAVSRAAVNETDRTAESVGAVVRVEGLPEAVTLGAYPNPVRSRATVAYAVPEAGAVRITVYNVLGQAVATLLDTEVRAGDHTVTWTPRGLASGVYFVRMQAGGTTATRRLTLVR
jgi:hypothetical protein